MLVLGIDAAWTEREPSGVALVGRSASRWQLLAVAASYDHYRAKAAVDPSAGDRPRGTRPDAGKLLLSSSALAGAPVDLVAIDMPLARRPITCRREADDAVSRAYGARKCGTHTPNPARPGAVSEDLRTAFEAAGFSLCTADLLLPGLLEVYPHPALVELAGAAERLPYKQGKTRAYWPGLTPPERRVRLFDEWTAIVELLDREIAGVSSALQLPDLAAPGWALKAFEDCVDAVVCAWVGACALEGRAIPFGDHEAAIWVPRAGASLVKAMAGSPIHVDA